MFKQDKRKQDEEDKIVDYIIQTYAEERTVEQNLLRYIEEQAGSEEEKREMAAAVDRYDTLFYEHPLFNRFKKQLFGSDSHFAILTHIELSVCFLISTNKYYPEAILDILWINKERFKEVVQSLETKLTKGGYRLPKGYKMMKPLIDEYFMISIV